MGRPANPLKPGGIPGAVDVAPKLRSERAKATAAVASSNLSEYLADIATVGVNMAGLPAVSIPAPRRDGELPVGVQVGVCVGGEAGRVTVEAVCPSRPAADAAESTNRHHRPTSDSGFRNWSSPRHLD